MENELVFDIPVENASIIKVLGVGGGGSNAVNHMYRQGIKDVDFVVCNTDAQALKNSPVPVKVQIGEKLTEGLGAGSKPEIGRQAAEENLEDVMKALGEPTKMVFITAGMGGGTGTGAAPVIARACKEKGILTVAIVTLPFWFEGSQKRALAVAGLDELSHYVDSLLVINNDKLREIFGDLTLSNAFSQADNILTMAAKSIAEIITVHGYINVDFADVETVVRDSGVAILGSGTAAGEDRARKAVEAALTSPLLNSNDITGAKNVLLNIASGKKEVTMDEVGEITDYITSRTDPDSTVIWGTCTDDRLEEEVTVTVIATGFTPNSIPDMSAYYKSRRQVEKVPLSGTGTDGGIIIEGKEPEFEVSDPLGAIGDPVETPTEAEQQMLDFNVKTVTEPYSPSPENPSTLLHAQEDPERDRMRLDALKATQESQKRKLGTTSEDRIAEMEEVPAYKRKNINLEEQSLPSSKTKISRFSLLQDDKEEKPRISDENPYLSNNVD